MLAAVYVVAFVATLWLPFVCADARSRAPPNASVVDALATEVNVKLALLLLFNAVNALICVWEIALWTHRANVQKLHRGYLKKFGNRVRVDEANARGRARRARNARRATDADGADDANARAGAPETAMPLRRHNTRASAIAEALVDRVRAVRESRSVVRPAHVVELLDRRR